MDPRLSVIPANWLRSSMPWREARAMSISERRNCPVHSCSSVSGFELKYLSMPFTGPSMGSVALARDRLIGVVVNGAVAAAVRAAGAQDRVEGIEGLAVQFADRQLPEERSDVCGCTPGRSCAWCGRRRFGPHAPACRYAAQVHGVSGDSARIRRVTVCRATAPASRPGSLIVRANSR